MASSLSQDFVQADRLIKRRYFQIPKDQRELLDSDGAWSENLGHGPHSMVNVPPEVVEDIKNLNKRQNAVSTNHSLPVKPASSNGANAPSRSSQREEAVSSPAPEEDIEDDAEGSLISWSQSPVRSGRPVRYVEHVPSQTSPSKIKALPPSAGDHPSSSAAQSEALEMQPLAALSQESRAPVNRAAVPTVATTSARPGATPPSAQEQIIPSTFSGKGQSVERKPAVPNPRRMESALPNKGPEPREQSRTSKASAIPPPAAIGSFQTTISTPPLITQASSEQPRQCSFPKAASRESSSNFPATWEGRRAPMATQRENLVQAPASSPPQSQTRATQRTRRATTPKNTRQSLPRTQNHKDARTPYERFKAAYPDYQESASIFVSALLYVEKLKRDWALPEFLYDDFVRAFSTGYLQYISMCGIQKADQILTAVQWYNDRTKDIQYRQNVITRDNIHGMVKAHAAEARKVRESVGGSGSEHGAALDDSDEDLASEDEQDGHVSELAGEAEREEVTSALMNSPQFHVSSPGSAEVDTTQPVQSEVLMTQLDTTNGEQLSSTVTATRFDKDDQQRSEELDSEHRVERRSPLASEPLEQPVCGIQGKTASHLVQKDAQVDEAAEETEWTAPDAAAESDGQERLDSEDHIMEDNIAVSRRSSELSISPPKLEVTDLLPKASKAPHQGAASPSQSFVSQEDIQMEDYAADDESQDVLDARVETGSPSSLEETHHQTQHVTVTSEAHRNGATPVVKATPSSSKSAQQASTKHYTPTTFDTGNPKSKPLESVAPATKKAQNLAPSKPQADSSDEDSEAFDPPVEEASVSRSRKATYSPSVPRTQARTPGEGSNALGTPVKVHMPPPETPSRSPPAFKAGITSKTTVTRSDSSAKAARLTEVIEPAQKVVTGERRVFPRASLGSASVAGKSGSPVSSERSYANAPMSKKRVNETKEERSRRLKEHFRRRMSGKTPSSSAVSRQ